MNEQDRNKTALTTRITATAAAYLDGAGFKPVETEVPVADGWIADLASFIYPSATEATRLRLINKRRVREYFTVDTNAFDELKFTTGPLLTALVEVKISRSDFRRDIDGKFATRHPPAHLCYLAYPTGLITPEEIPDRWIGLQMSKEGRRLVKRHSHRGFTLIHPQNPGDIANLAAAVGIRRDHRTRKRAIRDFLRAHRAEETDRRKLSTLRSVITGLVQWMNGNGIFSRAETIADLLRMAGFRGTLPKYAWEDVEKLETLRRNNAVGAAVEPSPIASDRRSHP